MPELHTSERESTPRRPALERRAWVRYSCDLDASCIPANEDPDILWPARVINIACGGVGLVLSRRFEPGTLLQVELQIPKRGFSRPLLMQVTHIAGHEFGGWLIGCSFTNPISDEELQQML